MAESPKHPLSFFRDLIERSWFNSLLQNFREITDVEVYQNEYLKYDKVAEKKVFKNRDQETGDYETKEYPFEEYLGSLLEKEYIKAMSAIDDQILTLSSEEARYNYLATIQLFLKYQAGLLALYQDADKYHVIIKTYLEKIENTVIERYTTEDIEEESYDDFERQTGDERLKWIKSTNAFFLLFAALKREIFISANKGLDIDLELFKLFNISPKYKKLKGYKIDTFRLFLKDSIYTTDGQGKNLKEEFERLVKLLNEFDERVREAKL